MENSIQCPYCGEEVEIELDLSEGFQKYIEDCSVCCQPIELRYRVHEEQVEELQVMRAQ